MSWSADCGVFQIPALAALLCLEVRAFICKLDSPFDPSILCQAQVFWKLESI
jgi:hypothetical protein